MHGIPFALKDIYDTRGILTSGHSRVFLDRVPAEDATTTASSTRPAPSCSASSPPTSGARGPLVRFALAARAQSVEPDALHGGSSSGSGAAVAAGLVPVALGSDTGGSIRGPASLCGVVGLMPTFGLVSRAGVITNSYTFDHCGPLARTVEDCALVLQALAGYDPKDAGSLAVRPPRTAPRSARICGASGSASCGATGKRTCPPPRTCAARWTRRSTSCAGWAPSWRNVASGRSATYFDVKIIIAESEIFSVHQNNLIARPKDFGADFRSRALPSVLFTAHDYVQATREHRRMMVEMEPLYARFDAFVTAGMGEAPKLADYRSISFWQKPSLLTAWNVTGQPVLALPNGFGRNGLPLGMQIVGRPFGEPAILRIGHAYERATEWHMRRPPLARGGAAPEVVPPPVLSEPRRGVDGDDARPLREGRAARRPSARRPDAGPAPGGRALRAGHGAAAPPRPRPPPRAGQRLQLSAVSDSLTPVVRRVS